MAGSVQRPSRRRLVSWSRDPHQEGANNHGRGDQDRAGVARAAQPRPVPGAARGRDRAAVHRQVHLRQGGGRLPLRRLRQRAVPLRRQVRLRHRLAQLHRAGQRHRGRAAPAQQPRHGPHRGHLRPLRLPPGPRLPRRPGPDRPALLHQQPVAGPGQLALVTPASSRGRLGCAVPETMEEPGLAEEHQRDQPAYNVLKTWAFDDWGLYGRGDELLARALARRLGGRGVTRLAMVRRDARAPYPVDADERQALDEVYKTQLTGADLVWAGTRELRDELAALNPRTVLHPIGADQGLAGGAPAAELAGLPRPLIIYAGSMRAYLNVGLIRGTADRLKEASFVFVGPAADFLQPLVAGLRNVHVIGPRPYRLLPDYLAAADVAIAPPQVAPATRAVVPEKLFGYLAAGLPVVTTEIAGAEELRRLVWIARDPSEFARAIQGALKRDRERRRALRQAAVSPLSWDAIAAHTVASVDAVRAGAELPDPPELKLPAIPGFLAR